MWNDIEVALGPSHICMCSFHMHISGELKCPCLYDTHVSISYQLTNIFSYRQHTLLKQFSLTSHRQISYCCLCFSLLSADHRNMACKRVKMQLKSQGLPFQPCDGPGRKRLPAGTELCCGWDYESCNHRWTVRHLRTMTFIWTSLHFL